MHGKALYVTWSRLMPSMPFMSKSAWNAYFGMCKKIGHLKTKHKLTVQYIYLNQLSCKDISYFLCIAIINKSLSDIADTIINKFGLSEMTI